MLNQKLSQYQFILASGSPRRHFLIRELGIDFSIHKPDVEEVWPNHLKGDQIAAYLAELKANAMNLEQLGDNPLVMTADTIVWINDHILTKPKDREDAINIISELSNNSHYVYTGVCLRSKQKQSTFTACSEVFFKKLSREEIEWYVDKYQPYDKAGAYGAQEWIGYIAIEKIVGSYFNVMGLPTQKLYDELVKF